jgi:zinc transport system ATP-binding protein
VSIPRRAGGAAAAPTGSPVFEIVDGTVAFEGGSVLDRLSMRVEQGSFVALLGGNGSGKTTLVRSLLGLQPLTSGRVRILGEPLDRFGKWDRIAFVPQRLPVATGVPISVMEMVSSARIGPRTRWRRSHPAARAAALDALDTVGLAARRGSRLDVLSGGQQRRVMIARALAGGADILVLDEPMAGVDLANQQVLAEVLASLEGHTIVMVAHGLGTVANLVTRAVVLDAGRIVHDGPRAPEGWADLYHHMDESPGPTILEG